MLCGEPGRLFGLAFLATLAVTACAADEKPNAAFEAHLKEVKAKAPAGFTVIPIPPSFVVLGDGPAYSVRDHAEGTVRWAIEKLKKDLFRKDPTEIIDIWLFKGDESYAKHAKELFNDKPTTPFGYYSDAHHALIMNISTGGGTLVHELVHPFMRANFPACPAWFNEGLASLYEQSGAMDGHIYGYTNWRLAGLQKAIRAKTVPSFESLTSTTDAEFYGNDKGTNYAQARYLCYYLQEKGLLFRYYHAFRKDAKTDPTGCQTLKKTLGEKDMDAFKKKWEDFVLGLKFP
jgi:hypothetical protein